MSERSFISLLSRPLLTGALALLPVGLTVAIVGWLVAFLASMLGPRSAVGSMLKQIGWNIGDTDMGAYAGGMLFALLLIYLLGLLVEIVLKDRWARSLDRLTSRIPVIGTVFDAASKIVEMLEPKKSTDMQSMTPVMCDFGGTSFPAFLPTSQSFALNGTDYHVVMIPTAPVPFGGAIMCVPKASVSPLDCGIDGLFNIYMSMGAVVPDYINSGAPAGAGRAPQSPPAT
jgi:uncharacterized membrane protein